ncbi:MAG: hypothetical protein GQ532_04455 [Methylomarinum sp.]|nr:hypothetical protein [Methylomarinum sp.]
MNFFSQLKNGDLGLAKTFWLYWIGAGFLLNLISFVADPLGPIFAIVLAVINLSYNMFIMFACWNAATKYKGPKIWKWLMKTVVVLLVIAIILAVIFVGISMI